METREEYMNRVETGASRMTENAAEFTKSMDELRRLTRWDNRISAATEGFFLRVGRWFEEINPIMFGDR